MTLQGGDREFGHGDQVTVVNNTGGVLEEGTAVEVSGRDGDLPTVVSPSVAGESDGVLADAIPAGESGQAILHGMVWVQVDATVSAGDVVDSTTGGLFSSGGANHRVYQGGDAIALIRYEN